LVRHSAIAKPKTPGLGSFVRNVAAQELLVDALGFTPARGTDKVRGMTAMARPHQGLHKRHQRYVRLGGLEPPS
jgi:hypothetical protein